jgi:two-component system phosphate regulon sensor histidine kinase PhoR
MPNSDLDRLAALIRREREPLLAQWRQQVRALRSAQHLDAPTLNDHLPRLIEELAAALQARSDETIPEALSEASPPAHGLQRVQDGYDIEEVVAEYNILRGCIHDLAQANGLTLQGKPFHILNRVLDGAIGLAVQTFANQRALQVRERREEYLSFVAHDLRTPLNAISLATRVLELALPERVANVAHAQMFRTLRRNVQHLDALVGKVIEENTGLLSELGIKLERRTFDLWPLVEGLIRDLEPVAHTASTRLVNQVPEDLAVFADADLLRRIFQNVIANAITYTPRGEVVIGARQAQGMFECWVSDNGEGIPPERLEKVFDKTETDPAGGGWGLGLAIVKNFVEAHEGVVSVESKEGLGSTFRFTLPPRQMPRSNDHAA